MIPFLQRYTADSRAQRDDLIAGLLQPQARVSPKHFYDRLGSMLFAAITELPEYYPTRTEAGILAGHGAEIAQAIGPGAALVDLGAGDCAKAMRLLPLLRPSQYVAVDISVDFLRGALQAAQREYPALPMMGIGLDFASALDLPADTLHARPVFFYPGSSLGNFTPAEALAFLRRVHVQAAGGGLLLGIDMVKPPAVLEAAYDDAIGLTAAFNLNLLRHLNRLIGADFQPAQWRHRARWVAAESRIEMHLVAREAVAVQWAGGGRRFEAGQWLHTENSCKYTPERIQALLHEAGFGRLQAWTDAQRWFSVIWAQA